jgi:hypothetical protein
MICCVPMTLTCTTLVHNIYPLFLRFSAVNMVRLYRTHKKIDFVLLYKDRILLLLKSKSERRAHQSWLLLQIAVPLSLHPPLDIFNGMPFFVPAINSHKHSWPSLFYNIFMLQLIYKDMEMMLPWCLWKIQGTCEWHLQDGPYSCTSSTSDSFSLPLHC